MKKKYVEILLSYRQLFVKGDVFIGEWGIFHAEVFLHYSWFFIKGDFIKGRVECSTSFSTHTNKLKRTGARIQACFTPLEISKCVEVSPLEKKIPIIPSWKSQIIWMNLQGLICWPYWKPWLNYAFLIDLSQKEDHVNSAVAWSEETVRLR